MKFGMSVIEWRIPVTNESFDTWDGRTGAYIGLQPRALCHCTPSWVHRAVHLLLFDPAGNLLLQKRALTKDIQPGKWDTSVGGHLDPGEDFETAVHRELAEELGINGVQTVRLYSYLWKSSRESEVVNTFMGIVDSIEGFRFCPGEIEEIAALDLSGIEQMIQAGECTPNFSCEWEQFNRYIHATFPHTTELKEILHHMLMRLKSRAC